MRSLLLQCISRLVAHNVDSLRLSRLDAIGGEADMAPTSPSLSIRRY